MHELSRTGAPMVALRLFEALARDFDIRVVARSGGPLEAAFRRTFPLTVLRPTIPGAQAAGRLRAAMFQLVEQSWRPDLVYVNTVAALPTWARLAAVRRHGPPVILHVHEGPTYQAEVEREFPGLIRGEPDRYIAVADWIADRLAREFRVASESITVVRPPVGIDWLEPDVSTPERPAPGVITVGGAGVPSPVKGTDLWLQTAADLIARAGPAGRYRFLWVGAGDNEGTRQMQREIERLGLNEPVRLEPHSEDVRGQFDSMDIFLMSSREESASLVVLESMALGRPVVCFAGSGGPPELVGDGGVIVQEFSAAAAADAIEALATDDSRRRELGLAGRERVTTVYSLEAAVAQLRSAIALTLETAP